MEIRMTDLCMPYHTSHDVLEHFLKNNIHKLNLTVG